MTLGETQEPKAMPAPHCAKCGSEMQEGFLRDNARNGSCVSTWIEGEAEYGLLGSVKVWGRPSRPTKTFRCVNCGFLESYAP